MALMSLDVCVLFFEPGFPLWLIKAHIDNEFTQLMKGLQGERLRQAFKHFDQDQDGLIKPDQFKRVILVSWLRCCGSLVV